jgi:hypothetical protein
MAGEYLLVNPRRKRARRKRARVSGRKRSHRRRRSAVAYNPRRRRYARRHVRRHRRAHRNPRLGGGAVMGNLTRGMTIGAGAVATNIATGFISKWLPANLTSGPTLLIVKAGVGLVALPMLLKMVPGGRKFASSVAVGAGVVIALDIFNAYIAPNIPGLHDYEAPGLMGYGGGDAPPEEIGAAENMYGDTIY